MIVVNNGNRTVKNNEGKKRFMKRLKKICDKATELKIALVKEIGKELKKGEVVFPDKEVTNYSDFSDDYMIVKRLFLKGNMVMVEYTMSSDKEKVMTDDLRLWMFNEIQELLCD